MSYNLVDPTTGDLTRVAGGIDTSIIPSDASASNKLATTDSTLKTIQLSGSVDCNTLTEPGLYTASAGAVSALANAPANIGSAVQLDGGFSILVTATNTEGTFFGSQMFIPYGSDLPFIRKSYYLNGHYWTGWQELVTMDKLKFVPSTILNSGFKVVAYSDREISGNSKLECLENWITNALSKYISNLVVIGNIYNINYVDGFVIVNVWGDDTKGILGASGILVDQNGIHYYRKINGASGSGTLTRII